MGGAAQASGGAATSGGAISAGGAAVAGSSVGGSAGSSGASGNAGACSGPAPEPLAFPGAEGFGKATRGGRGGDVFHVTSLEDSGPGSLREGVTTATGPRTIVFDVSGTIVLSNYLRIEDKSHITIAGQTAPGDGITLANHALYVNRASHVIVRYIRSRLGDTSGAAEDAVSVLASSHVVFDHCSLSWSTDSVFDLTKFTGMVSVQWCILSEALTEHSFAAGWDGKGAGGGSYHHNLLASCRSRMPRVDGVDPMGEPGPLVDIRNNVIYNWGNGNAYGAEFANMNFVANYLKPGPSSFKLGWLFEVSSDLGRIFVKDNFVGGQPGITADNATGVNRGVVDVPFAVVDVPTETPEAAYDAVLAHVGASKVRDSVDLRIIDDVRNGTGQIITSQSEVGGWPALGSLPPPADTDRDGMPDAWETAHELDANDPEDRNGDLDCDGYSNLEEYLNELVER